MENNEISDNQLTVSSFRPTNWVKNHGRLNFEGVAANAWLAHWGDTNKWFQVDFILIVTVVEILTQGGKNYFTKTYQVSYGYDSTFFQAYKQGGATKVIS